jgi:hypothetical protein
MLSIENWFLLIVQMKIRADCLFVEEKTFANIGRRPAAAEQYHRVDTVSLSLVVR